MSKFAANLTMLFTEVPFLDQRLGIGDGPSGGARK